MLTRDQVRHVAFLARLDLTPAEEDQFTEQLAGILSYVEQLDQLNTEGIEPTFHVLDLPHPTHPDTVKPWEDLESILANAPERADQFFKVPRILVHQEE